MLSQLKIQLKDENKVLGYNSGSIFQGLIMEMIDPDYGERLHHLSVNPYSQYIKRTKKGAEWIITTLNQEAYEKIITPLLEVEQIDLKKKELKFSIYDRELKKLSRQAFVEKHLFEQEEDNRLIFYFNSPTAFKRDNHYIFLPEVSLIFQSLMKKFDATGEDKIFTPELLEEIDRSVYISNYRLKSGLFYLEKTRIPGFTGRLELRSHTHKEVRRILKLLNQFSAYAGVGIKTSMGMGGVSAGGEQNG